MNNNICEVIYERESASPIRIEHKRKRHYWSIVNSRISICEKSISSECGNNISQILQKWKIIQDQNIVIQICETEK